MTPSQVCQRLEAILAGRRSIEVGFGLLRCKPPNMSAWVVSGRRPRDVRQACRAMTRADAIRGLVRQLVQEPAIPLTPEQSELLRPFDLELDAGGRPSR